LSNRAPTVGPGSSQTLRITSGLHSEVRVTSEIILHTLTASRSIVISWLPAMFMSLSEPRRRLSFILHDDAWMGPPLRSEGESMGRGGPIPLRADVSGKVPRLPSGP